jgi:hypothetical protein
MIVSWRSLKGVAIFAFTLRLAAVCDTISWNTPTRHATVG